MKEYRIGRLRMNTTNSKADGYILILDTSAIISLVQNVTPVTEPVAPGFACVLGDCELVIPRVVLDELDKLKRDSGERGKIAIEAARQLENYSLTGCLIEGVETEKGGLLRLAARPAIEKISAWGLKPNFPDHEILATALEVEDLLKSRDGYAGDRESPCNVKLITQDRILRILARSVYGVQAEELKSVWAPQIDRTTGYNRVELESDEFDRILDAGEYTSEFKPFSNEYFHIVDKSNPEVRYCYGINRNSEDSSIELIDRANVDFLKVAGDIQGRNVRQKLLLWTLMGCGESDPMADKSVKLVTVSGPAGSGKSFLTLAAAWERLERGNFERIIVTRPMVEVGTSLGFLPGTLEEKLQPWGGLVEDSLRAIVQVPAQAEGVEGSRRGVQRAVRPLDAKAWLEMENRLELVPLAYIRGRTFRNCFVILEEAQNIERGPLKVLLTRLGEGSMIVVIGDMSQIDSPFLSPRNNGLVHAINSFRSWPQAVHIGLEKIVRSDLAEAATRLL